MRSPQRSLYVFVSVLLGSGCSDGTGPKAGSANSVRLTSDRGDYIGAGETHSYTQADAVIAVNARPSWLSIKITGDQSWAGDFRPPGLTRLKSGMYAGLSRYDRGDTTKGGIAFFGEGRGCLVIAGSFSLDRIVFIGDSVNAFDLRFEQHCEQTAPALLGTIHWRADDPTRPVGPAKIPGRLWQPPPGATPASGDFVYLEGDVGDFLASGQKLLFTEPRDTIVVSGSREVMVTVGKWRGFFRPMNTLTQMQPGYYPGVLDLNKNPTKGGMGWEGFALGCSGVNGWFAIDRVTYISGRLTAIELRFEQHCGPVPAALRGKVRWTA